MVSLSQTGFEGGEIAPALWARNDLKRYPISLKTCLNFVTMPYGPATTRPGTEFKAAALDSANAVRTIPFTASGTDYLLELGNHYISPSLNGVRLRLTAHPSVYNSGTTYAAGDMCRDASYNAYISIAGSNTGNTPAASPTWWLPIGGSSTEYPYEVRYSPWPSSVLFDLKYAQVVDVMTVCHPSYAPQKLSRVSSVFTLAAFANDYGPMQDTNKTTSLTVYSSAVSGSVTLTASASMFTSADIGKLFYIEQQNAGKAWVAATAVSSSSIRRANGRYWYTAAGGTTGTNRPGEDDDKAKDGWDDGGVSWTYLHPGFGIAQITAVSSATAATATVITRIPDDAAASSGATYKWAKGAWNASDGYPGCVTFHQQREFFGGSAAFPQTIWGSKTNDYTNFGKSSPMLDDDVLIYPLAARKVNSIRNLLTLGRALIAFTSDAIWAITSPDNDFTALTQTNVSANPETYFGASEVSPLCIGNAALYIQKQGQSVQDLAYSFADDAYIGGNLSQFAPHLVDGYTLLDWCYQCVPYSVVWCVRSDGELLGLTYVRNQVVGWHHHDLGGIVESVCCLTEDDEDAVYLVVKRTINGSTVRCIERMADRRYATLEDSHCVDCGLAFNGWNTTTKTITISGGTTWDYGETLTLTASASTFASGDVGSAIMFKATDGSYYRLDITAFTSATVVSGTPNRLIPAAYRVARTDWGFGRKTFTVSHLEGETVSILADGNVHPQKTVSSGTVTLDYPAVKVHIGLPFVSDLELLDLNIPGQETIRNRKKTVYTVGLQVDKSRGFWVGYDANHLSEWKQRTDEVWGAATGLFTGLAETNIESESTKDINILIRQTDPLPLTVTGVICTTTIGGA